MTSYFGTGWSDLKEKLKLNLNTNLETIVHKKPCLNVSLNRAAKCYPKPVKLQPIANSIQDERNENLTNFFCQMKVDKDKLQRTAKYAVMTLPEETQEITATQRNYTYMYIEVTLIFVMWSDHCLD